MRQMWSSLALSLLAWLQYAILVAGEGFPYHRAAALSLMEAGPIRKSTCKRLPGLTEKQIRWCKSHYEFIQPIVGGTKLGLDECKRRFSRRRWSCPTDQPSVFNKALATANPEAAFVHAIESAGITLAIARTCSRGDAVLHCGCDKDWTAAKPKDFTWGSCSDNFVKGEQFTRQFLNARKNDTVPLSVVESHNFETGRQIVNASMQLVCKCHGLTGTCTQRTCWYSLPKVQVIGQAMIKKYDRSVRVKWSEPRSDIVPYSALVSNITAKLVYTRPSQDYCVANETSGSLGTPGRECDPTKKGHGGCDQLCCNRGANERRRIETKKCKCKFIWCCKVHCQQCRGVKRFFTCQ